MPGGDTFSGGDGLSFAMQGKGWGSSLAFNSALLHLVYKEDKAHIYCTNIFKSVVVAFQLGTRILLVWKGTCSLQLVKSQARGTAPTSLLKPLGGFPLCWHSSPSAAEKLGVDNWWASWKRHFQALEMIPGGPMGQKKKGFRGQLNFWFPLAW